MKSFIAQGEQALQEQARQIKITGTVSDVFHQAINATMIGEDNAANQEAILAAAAMESAQQEASIFAVLASKVESGHKLIDPWDELYENPNNTLVVTIDGSNANDNEIFDVRDQLEQAEGKGYSEDSGLVVSYDEGDHAAPLILATENFAKRKGFKVYHVTKKKK